MTYKEKSYDEVFNGMLQDAFKEKLISHDDQFLNYIANKQDISNFYVMLLAIHSEAIADVYKEITEVYKSSKVDYATGNDLDDIGDIVDCSRPPATYAYVELVFTSKSDSNTNSTIPSGVIVSSKNNNVSYRTLESMTFTSENNSCTVSAVATIPGVAGRVASNVLTRVNDRNYNVNVTNPSYSTGGTDAFTDEQYRELLKNWVKTKQKGNLWAYKDYFSRLDGLDDYSLIPNWDGTGTIKCIISPSSSYFLNKTYNELQDTVTQLSEDIVVVPPVNVDIDIYVDCNVDIDRLNPYSKTEKDIIKGKILDESRKYIESLRIGEDFIPHKLAVWLDKTVSELKNINFNYPTGPITVTGEEKCVVGNIEVIME